MMAASVIENGSPVKVECRNPVSMHNVSLHDPTVEKNPASPTTPGYVEGEPSDDLEEARNSSSKLHRSFSSAGKQLAESATLGQKADKSSSEFPYELSASNSSTYSDESIPPLTGDEAKIALSQLQELEVAIKERKDTRIDGRKTRWAIFRRLRRHKPVSNSESLSNISSCSENEFIPGFDEPKDNLKIKRESGSNFKVNQLKTFVRNYQKSISDCIKFEESPEPVDDIYTTNNNSTVTSNFNHSETSLDTMKVEDAGPILGPIETNNVLETMKQQFLEGTCNISESTQVSPKEKKTKKKLKRNVKSNCTNDENIKRKPGRPKKKEQNIVTSTPKPEGSSIEISKLVVSNDHEIDPFTPIVTEAFTPKKENQIMLQLSPEFYLRKNPVTRGLREVRKSESGSESNSSTPIKDNSLHLQLSPGSPGLTLNLSPNTLSPIKYENTNGAAKFSPIAKALLNYDQERKLSGEETSKHKLNKKLFKGENTSLKNKSSPQKIQIENGDSQSVCALNKFSTKAISKRGRGRKRGSVKNSWPKKTSMIVADVHNSMNGEPQAVINTSKVGRIKKKLPPKVSNPTASSSGACGSLEKRLNDSEELASNKENSIGPTVPSLKSPQRLKKTNVNPANSAFDVNTPKKVCSKSTNDGVKNNHLNLENKDSPQENGSVSILDMIPKDEFVFEYVANKFNYSKDTKVADCESSKSLNRKKVSSITKNIVPEKKKRSILDYNTDSRLTKDKLGLHLLAKSFITNKCESMKNVSLLLNNTSCKSTISNGNETVDESCTSNDKTHSPDPLASPRKSMSAYSPDKQKSEKYSKVKSLSAVIEKLNKPTHHSNYSSEDELKNGNVSSDDKKVESVSENKIITTTGEFNEKEYNKKIPIINFENSAKPKKPPRFLTELFKDEGVQIMLGSMKPDVIDNGDIIESGPHKLRPKRINDNNLSESPEPEESFQKRKKRHTEVDSLFVDEGALNLLTSIESTTRRPSFSSDTPSDNQKGNTTKAPKHVTSTLKMLESKKRKLSGASNGSASLMKYCLPYNKRMKLNTDKKPTVVGDVIKKKVGRPSNAELKKKQLNESIASEQQSTNNISLQKSPVEIKSVPPLKIKLTQYDDGYTKPSISPSEQAKLPISYVSSINGKLTKATPSGQEEALKASNQTVAKPRTIPSGSEARFHGVPINKLLPAGTLKTIKLGLIKPLNKDSQTPKIGKTEAVIRQSQRASVRNNEVNNHFRDIHLRKFHHFMHIIFNPSTTKMTNAFNSRVLRELCEALNYIKKDPSVNLVLLTATGSTFCQGIDLTSLQHSNIEIRKKNATNLTRAIKEFLHCLISFPKVIIAGINGNATGLGVTMLPLFDLVIASDKAEFFLPYGELGQVPEGGATYTFPQNYGKLQSNNMFMGKKITATQAQTIGLVSETLWPATFSQELIPRVASIAAHPGSGLEATKSLMNHYLMTKLELSVEAECRTLLQQWSSSNFATQCKRYLESNNVLYQSPAFTKQNH